LVETAFFKSLTVDLGYKTTMREIASALGEENDYLFCAISACGAIRDCSEYVRDHNLKTTRFAVDAVGSVTFGGKPAKRLLPDTSGGEKISADLAGIYKEECRVVEISQSNGKLFARIPSQRIYELIYCGGLVFCLRCAPGYSIEFVANEYEKITGVIAVHPEFSMRLHLNDAPD
jgi:hypothetical protein